jgi:arylsulfatase A-like enzyme
MKHPFALISILAALLGSKTVLSEGIAHTEATPERERPNVLFILIDDLGWKDTGFMGSDFYETPHLDHLASESMVFTQAYACAANCAPSRASLMSGQYTPRHEIYNVGTQARGKAAHRRLEHVAGTATLRRDIPTWANALQQEGYKTATLGKWHLSDDPTPYGFDLNVGGTHAGSPPKGYYPPHGKAPGLEAVPPEEFLTTTLGHRAVDFITQHHDSPWAVYLTLFAVHTPIQAKKDLLAPYKDKTPGRLHQNVAMATMVQAVDDAVGMIMERLRELGLDDQTIVVFFSDNGGYGPATDMAPLKGYKGTYYEGGIRVPCFVRWPGITQTGTINATPIIGVDFYPTLLEMTHTPMPASLKLDGMSLVPLLKGASLPTRALYWHFPAYLQSYGAGHTLEQRDPLFRSRPVGVIREGPWKLMEFFESGDLELYHLDEDIGETQNLVAQHPDKAKAMHAALKQWQQSMGAPIPTKPNPSFDAIEEQRAINQVIDRRRALKQVP